MAPASATHGIIQEILALRSAAVAADLLRRQPDGTWPEEPLPIGRDDTVRLDSISLTRVLSKSYRGA